MNRYQEELFKSIEIIVEKKLAAIKYTYQIEVKLKEKTGSLSYLADYQGTTITVYSNGPVYSVGDDVHVLVTNGKLSAKKFILGTVGK